MFRSAVSQSEFVFKSIYEHRRFDRADLFITHLCFTFFFMVGANMEVVFNPQP